MAINAKPDSRSGTAWVAGAKIKDPTITLVNCTGDSTETRNLTINQLHCAGGRRGHPHFENQPGKLPGGRRSAETKDLTISLVNCTGGRRRAQGSDNQSLERRHHHFQNQPGQLQGGRRRNKSFDKRSRKLHGWQAQRPGIRQSIRLTAPMQAHRPGIGTAFQRNVSYTRVQHHCMIVCVCLYVYDCCVCLYLYGCMCMIV